MSSRFIKKLCALWLFLSVSNSSFSADTWNLPLKFYQCDLTVCLSTRRFDAFEFPKGKLTHFWAQEYIGADLAKEFLVENQELLYTPKVGLFDWGFSLSNLNTTRNLTRTEMVWGFPRTHGNLVANLLNGLGFEGISPHSQYIWIQAMVPRFPFEKGITAILKESLKVDILNRSTPWGRSKDESQPTVDALRKMVDTGTIAVTSAGNTYPLSVELAKEEFKDLILAGSASPLGLKSSMSSESEKVLLYAPSDRYILSSGYHFGSYLLFGGSSGATPIISGIAANILSFLPFADLELVKTILFKTALDAPGGFKLVNALKSVLVAKNLKSLCSEIDDKLSCAMNLAQNPESFLVKTQKVSERKFAQIFPSCSSVHIESEMIIKFSDRIDLLKSLRKIALLDQTRKSIWRKLSCIYGRMGFTWNARFYDLMSLKGQKEESFDRLLENQEIPTLEALRNPSVFSSSIRTKLIQDSLSSSKPAERDYAEAVKFWLQ